MSKITSIWHARSFFTPLIVSVILLVGLFVFGQMISKSNSEDKIKSKISLYIDNQFVSLDRLSSDLSGFCQNNGQVEWSKSNKTLQNTGQIAFIYFNDTLRYWNTHTVDQVNTRISNSQGDTIVETNNGLYLMHQSVYNNFIINVLSPIQHLYKVKNKLLVPKIIKKIGLEGELSLKMTTGSEKGSVSVSKDPIYQIYFFPDSRTLYSLTQELIILIFYLLIWLFLSLTIFKAFNKWTWLKNSQHLFILGFTITVLLLRAAIQYFKLEPLLEQCGIFVNQISTIPFLSSIGEIIINLFLFLILLLIVSNKRNQQNSKINTAAGLFSFTTIAVIALASINVFLYNLGAENVFGIEPKILLNLYANWPIVIIIWLLNAIAFVLLVRFGRLNLQSTLNKVMAIVGTLVGLILIGIATQSFEYVHIVAWIVVTLVLSLQMIPIKNQSLLVSTLAILLLLSASSAYIINSARQDKEMQIQAFKARMLAQKNDPLFEYQFEQLEEKILQDTIFREIVLNEETNTDADIENYLFTNYFDDSSSKYNIQLTICGSDDMLDIPGENTLVPCDAFFADMAGIDGVSRIDTSLFLIKNTTENIYYLGVIPFRDIQKTKTLYLEFVASYVPEGLGYPELLIDQNAQSFNLANTSYARYYDNTLAYKFGDVKYPILLSSESNLYQQSGYKNDDDFRHFIVTFGKNETIIVSVPVRNLSETIFPFSILFLFFTLTAAIIFFIKYLFNKDASQIISFRTKLQFFIIGTIIFTTILLAVVTMFFMRNNAIENTRKQLEEKTYSVFIELQHKMGDEIDFSEEENQSIQTLLKKFSLVFFSDINLYTPSGELAATSRPEMEEKGLLSNMINPEAYHALMIDHQLSFITQEQIGELTFYSAYLPLFLSENEPAAIINLPFFARQSEIVQTYASLLANFINIAVLIGIIGSIFSIILARFLTRPLFMLQQRMAGVQIDKPNQSIAWKNNDEIGKLIEQYNLMVEKLEISAELIKDAERENTWREMARQIAHEIKNPLTPMKLNVQYLEKAYLEKQPDFQNKLTLTTKSLIEQIETLNNVAEMFGEVASSHSKTFRSINLNKLLAGVVDFFDNSPDIVFKTQYPEKNCYINAIEKDLLRAMNNLIKNAVQSFSNQSEKTIKITCTCEMNEAIITISDNGKGIDTQTQQNIFKPYFTTKTSGTGLGLAIVKSIITENGGRISFTSKLGLGTTFTLVFPCVKAEVN